MGDEATKLGVAVDPAGGVDDILEIARENGLSIRYIIVTHAHFDHVAGIADLVRKTGARVVAHRASAIRKDIAVDDGYILNVGKLSIKMIHTPGHSLDSMVLLVNGRLLTGDTLFIGSCGRTDLPGGDAGALYDSLFNKIGKLDDNLMVYPGHDYGDNPYAALGYEKRHNYAFKQRSKEAFMNIMQRSSV